MDRVEEGRHGGRTLSDITETVPLAEDALTADLDFHSSILRDRCDPVRRENLGYG